MPRRCWGGMLTAGKVAAGVLETAGIFSEAVMTTLDGEGVLLIMEGAGAGAAGAGAATAAVGGGGYIWGGIPGMGTGGLEAIMAPMLYIWDSTACWARSSCQSGKSGLELGTEAGEA